MSENYKFKQPYRPPKVTAVSFMVEEGFQSIKSALFPLDGSNTDSYTPTSHDFWSTSNGTTSFGNNDSYSRFEWGW